METAAAERMAKADVALIQSYVKELGEIKSADELSALSMRLVRQVQLLGSPYADNNSMKEILNQLATQSSHLAGAWSLGALPAVEQTSRSTVATEVWSTALEQLRQRIYRNILSRRTGFADLSKDAYTGLTLKEALMRLGAEAGAAGDWKHALEIHDVLNTSGSPWVYERSEARNAIQSYLRGLQQEASGDAELAVESYRVVTATIAEGIPLKEASARLAELRKKNPDAFKPLPPRYLQR